MTPPISPWNAADDLLSRCGGPSGAERAAAEAAIRVMECLHAADLPGYWYWADVLDKLNVLTERSAIGNSTN